jgi:hypothetical protein
MKDGFGFYWSIIRLPSSILQLAANGRVTRNRPALVSGIALRKGD